MAKFFFSSVNLNAIRDAYSNNIVHDNKINNVSSLIRNKYAHLRWKFKKILFYYIRVVTMHNYSNKFKSRTLKRTILILFLFFFLFYFFYILVIEINKILMVEAFANIKIVNFVIFFFFFFFFKEGEKKKLHCRSSSYGQRAVILDNSKFIKI